MQEYLYALCPENRIPAIFSHPVFIQTVVLPCVFTELFRENNKFSRIELHGNHIEGTDFTVKKVVNPSQNLLFPIISSVPSGSYSVPAPGVRSTTGVIRVPFGIDAMTKSGSRFRFARDYFLFPIRERRKASMKPSISPLSTAAVFPVSYSVRWSLTIW